jgi:diguanylate cyclase (GGDEF)-like protein
MKNNKFNLSILPVFMMVLIFAFGGLMEYRHTVEQEKKSLREELTNIQTKIENLISSRIVNANGMASIIEVNGSLQEESFDIFAKGIMDAENTVVKDVVFITDTTISYVYPRDLGQGAIGVDLASIPEQRELLLFTKSNLVEVFFGPVDLVEGGKGIIVRVPVAIDGDYYGQVAVVFDYDEFIDKSGLKSLADRYYVALKGNNPIDESYSEIWSSGDQDGLELISKNIRMSDIDWVICAAPHGGWTGFSPLFFVIILAGLIVVTGALSAYKKENTLKLELKTLAEHDELTGLYNRRLFREHLQASIDQGNQGVVALIDIDNFKHINDIHGHVFGDQILIDFSRALVESVGTLGRCYRFGGDEFLVIFEGAYDQSQTLYMAKVLRETTQRNLTEITSNHITVSAGVVMYPDQASDVKSLLIRADVAMYESKLLGKNRTKIFKDSMLDLLDKKINIERHIQIALENKGFEMYYQPIVDAESSEVISYEALIRFKDRGFSPDEFITVAESSGLIISLGRWILEEVFSTLASWRDKGYKVKPVAINLSPKQLIEPNFRSYLFERIEAHNLSTELIEIEITENILLENKDENMSVLRDLRNQGIKISMDDFGTGYSSLNYLTFLPIDKVKIDKSLKDQFMMNENPQILNGIIMMVHGLGYTVVAEGIENENELNKLRALGCDEIQGYYFGRPMPEEEVERRL